MSPALPPAPTALRVYYGGTFDPIHRAHLAIARAARDGLQCPVTLIPAADPPGRPPPRASALQRLRMVELAVAAEAGIDVSDCELRRTDHLNRPSYTIDTLAELRQGLGETVPIAWLLGSDAFAHITHWHRWQDLLTFAHLVIADRPMEQANDFVIPAVNQSLATPGVTPSAALHASPCGQLLWLHQPTSPLSASHIRAAIAARVADWDAFVHPAVAHYIESEQLYLS